MKRWRSPLGGWPALAAVLAVLGAPAWAASDAEGAERDSIATERAAAEARFHASDSECRQRFIVSSCLEEARQERRKKLDALRARQLVVDETRRRERVEARRRELAEKTSEDAQRDRDRAAKVARAAPASASAGASAPRPSAVKSPSLPREQPHAPAARRPRTAASSAAQRRAEEDSHRAAFEKKQQDAAAHRDEALGDAARRMLQRQPARSLPTPPIPPAKGASGP